MWVKKIFSILICAALLVCLLPAMSVFAADRSVSNAYELHDAIDNASPGDTVGLSGNITDDGSLGNINISTDITLNLNEHTLSINDGTGIVVSSATHLTIQGNGKITGIGRRRDIPNNKKTSDLIYVNSSGRITVNGGIIESVYTSMAYETAAIRISDGGTVTINNGGTITNSDPGNGDYGLTDNYLIANDFGGSVVVSGGTLTAKGDGDYAIYNKDSGSVTVSSGKVESQRADSFGIYNAGTGTVTVSGGEVTSTGSRSSAIYNAGTGIVTLSGCTVRGGTTNPGITSPSGNVNITGETIVWGGPALSRLPTVVTGLSVLGNTIPDQRLAPLVTLTDGNISSFKYLCFKNSQYFDVNFNMQGHGAAPAAQSIVLGGKVSQPPAKPVASGYLFSGWYKEAACTNPWVFNIDTVSANTTIYAKWISMPITASGNVFDQGAAPAGGAVFTFGAGVPGFNVNDNYQPGSATIDGYIINIGSVGAPGTYGKIEDGSIKITLNKAALDSLLPGVHTLSIMLQGVYLGHSATSTITVHTAPTTPTATARANPSTGVAAPFASYEGPEFTWNEWN